MRKAPHDRVQRGLALAALTIAAAAGPALAQTAIPDQPPSGPAPLETREPRLLASIAPYAWMPGLSGDITLRGADIQVDQSFLDIAEESDTLIGLMGDVDLSFGRLVFNFNGAWARTGFDDEPVRFAAGSGEADVELEMAWIEFAGGYRVLDRPLGPADPSRRFTLDGLVGGRVTVLEVDARFTASEASTFSSGETLPAGASVKKSASETWVEPFIGARISADLSDHWRFQVRGDVGGFGAGSDFAWQAAALFGYRWPLNNWDLTLFAGYRALGQDYDNGDFEWDVVTHGPLLGLQFTF